MQSSNSNDLEGLIQQVNTQPGRADLRYLLGARYASEGRYETAIEEMARAVTLNPELHTAIFQLGLLHLTSGREPEARMAWRALDGLADANPLVTFRKGLEALINNDFLTCARLLESGISANPSNPALNRDMAMVAARALAAANGSTEQGEKAGATPVIRTDFSLYDEKSR